jgi:hypothetical protein
MMHGGGGGGGGAGEGGGGGVGGGRNIFKAAREPLCPHVDACRTRHHTRTRCSLGALQYPMKQKLRRQRSKRPWRRAAPVIGKVCARLPSSAVVERTHCHGLKKGARRARYRTLARDSAFHEFSRMSPRFTRSRVKSRNAQGSARARLTNPAPQRRGTVPRPGVGRRWGGAYCGREAAGPRTRHLARKPGILDGQNTLGPHTALPPPFFACA